MAETMKTSRQTNGLTHRQDRRQEQRAEWEAEGPQTVLAFQVLLAQGSLEQIPAGLTAALSHQVGNSTLLSVLTQRKDALERVDYRPAERPLDTPPLDGSRAEAPLIAAPAFSGLSPLSTAPGGAYAEG